MFQKNPSALKSLFNGKYFLLLLDWVYFIFRLFLVIEGRYIFNRKIMSLKYCVHSSDWTHFNQSVYWIRFWIHSPAVITIIIIHIYPIEHLSGHELLLGHCRVISLRDPGADVSTWVSALPSETSRHPVARACVSCSASWRQVPS
jgi:hypothetical protein